MHDNEIRKLKSLVNDEVWELFVNNNVIIAGGAITSVFCNRDVNDIDVYFRKQEDCVNFINDVYESGFSLIVSHMTNRSILMRDGTTQQDVQLIVYKWHEDGVQSIFNDYDYTINMGALEFVDGEPQIVLHEEFLKHNSQRYLKFNENTTYPLISALRVQKYVERGYKISKAQMLRVLLSISKLEINDWGDLKNHVGGFYGMNMDEVFPEDKPFSLDEALTTLDTVYGDSTFNTIVSHDLAKTEVLRNLILMGFTKEELRSRVSAEGRYFKWVGEEGGEMVSLYREEFKYPGVGGKVDGGVYGIFVERGYAVVDHSYSEEGALILEMACPSHKILGSDFTGHLQMMGEVEVIGKYTLTEFLKKFKEGSVNHEPEKDFFDSI